MSINFKEILETVKANGARLKQCPRHRFVWPENRTLGTRLKCENCGGEMDVVQILRYVEGCEAAGGKADDIVEKFNG